MGVKGEQAQGQFPAEGEVELCDRNKPRFAGGGTHVRFAPEALRDVEYDAPQVDPVECKRRYDIEIIAHVLPRVSRGR